MIDEKLIGEQPSPEDATSATNVGFDNVSPDSQEGSLLGKFKDVESLMKAYNNLHSEFTKKCQTLNELLRENKNVDNAIAPTFENNNWQENVDKFLKTHPQAKSFTKQITEEISSDKVFYSGENSLEIAYSKVLEKENSRLADALNGENLLNLINEETKEQIINDYLKQVNSSPFLITSKGGNNVVTSYKKPYSVNEAGEMAKKLFK